MTVETYTNQGGSNMDRIEYKEGVTIREIAEDLRRCYGNWDYAEVYDGDNWVGTIIR